MKNVVWASNTVSVIVLPSGPEGERLLDVAKQWTASFVLGPALWVLDHHIPEDNGEAPNVQALVLGRDKDGKPESSQVNLFWALGSQEFSLVRMLAVRSEQAPEIQATTTDKVRLLERYLDASRPSIRGLDKSKPIGTQMVKLNLVFSSTGDTKRIPQSVIEASWDANIVAAPEDRPTPGSFDAFAQRNQRYPGFVLAHIATAAGIWAGLPKSTYEMGGDHATANRARFQRVFIRAVATDKLSGDLAKWALERAATPDSEATLGRVAGRQIAAVRTSQVPEKVQELVDHLMSGTGPDDFKYRPIPGTGWRAEPTINLIKKLSIRIADFSEGIKYIPKFLAEVVNQSIDKDLNEEEAIGYLPRRLDPRFKISDSQEVLNQPKPRVEHSSSNLWQHVRETFSSSLDSPSHFHLPKPLDAGDGKRLILGDTSSVFPDPASNWEEADLALAAGVSLDRVSWIDAASAKEQLNKIIEKGIELKPGMDEARDEVKEIKEQFEKYVIAEKQARIALKQVEVELKEDIIFAENIRKQHPHNLPKDIVGEPRETVLLPGENLDEDSNEPDPKDGKSRDDGDVNPDGDSSNG
jgi:hypothetical protein